MIDRCVIAAVAALAAPALAQDGCLLIDDFSMGELDVSTRLDGFDEQLDADNALGSSRRVSWDIIANPSNTRLNLQIAFDGTPGFAISMGTANASQVGLTYGGSGSDPDFPLLGLNLNDLGLDALRLDFGSVDLETRVAIELLDYDGGAVAGRASASALIPASNGLLLAISFSDFATVGGFDFSEVNAVQFVFNSTELPDRDVFLRELKFIPSPASAGLLGLGLLAAARRRRA